MNIYASIGIIAIIFFSGFPLLKKEQRSRRNVYQFIKSIIIVLLMIILVYIKIVSFIFAIILGIMLFILFDRKTYTKRRLIIYGSTIAILIISGYILFKTNPNYILNYLAKHPENSSLYVARNGETLVDYEADTPRPLASVVKTVIAVEYAYQVENNDIDKNERIHLETLNRYYFKNTDGGAHKKWLDHMQDEKKIINKTVSLHDVAKGMITFSSNANTDYLIERLGIEHINQRLQSLKLDDHDDIYPLVGALFISLEHKHKSEDASWIDELYKVPEEEYKQLALTASEKMKNEEVALADGFDLSVKEQRVWSDRLPKAPASTYGKLFHIIASDQLPKNISQTVRDIMEWPMKMVKENQDSYKSIGAKGGSTAFVSNQAMYIETLDDDVYEIILLMDDLSSWHSFFLPIHMNAFIVEIVNNEEFLHDIQKKL